jgi:hypothetical protein
MTRGRLILIADDKDNETQMYSSTEFNSSNIHN